MATLERLTDGLSMADFFCSPVLSRQSQFPDLTGCVANRQSLALKDQSLVPSPPAPLPFAVMLPSRPGKMDPRMPSPRWPT